MRSLPSCPAACGPAEVHGSVLPFRADQLIGRFRAFEWNGKNAARLRAMNNGDAIATVENLLGRNRARENVIAHMVAPLLPPKCEQWEQKSWNHVNNVSSNET